MREGSRSRCGSVVRLTTAIVRWFRTSGTSVTEREARFDHSEGPVRSIRRSIHARRRVPAAGPFTSSPTRSFW